MTCENCTSEHVTAISMTMAGGEVVDFVSCRHCEYRVWRSNGNDLPLPRVLALAGAARRK